MYRYEIDKNTWEIKRYEGSYGNSLYYEWLLSARDVEDDELRKKICKIFEVGENQGSKAAKDEIKRALGIRT